MAAHGGGGGGGGSPAADGRQIDAFTVQDVLVEKRMLCLEAWGGYALIGLSDGTLLLASQRAPTTPRNGDGSTPASDAGSGSEASSSAAAGEERSSQLQWAVVQSLRGFGTGSIKQLVVAKQRSMLLCLADDGVNAFVLPSLRLKAQAGRTRGASLFSWHGPSDTLAVAAKKRVLVFRYDGLEFVEQREVSLPDPPTCLAQAGNTLYVGTTRQDYLAVDVASGTVSQLFTTKGPAACAVAVSPTEVLLARDSGGVLYGPEGRPAKRGIRAQQAGGNGKGSGLPQAAAVLWSTPPAALAVSGPFVATLSEAGAEARLVEPLDAADLWQQLALTLPGGPPVTALSPSAGDDGSLFVGSRESGAIKQLRPVGFDLQALQLLGMGEHEEALAMAALLPPAKAEQRRQLEDRIHLSFGQRLFRQGEYDEALLHFGMSSLAGPLQLLRLFPSLAPPKLLAAAEAETTAEQAGGSTGGGEAAEAAAEAEPKGDAFVAAVQGLTPYLLSHRSRLAAAAASPAGKGPGQRGGHGDTQQPQQQQQQQQTPQGAGAASPEAPGPSPATRAVLVQQRLEGSATAALLDTALLLALLAVPDSGALLRFVQRPNCVDLKAGEAALKAAGRYSELVALYQTKGRHSAALELLHTLSQSPENLPAPAQGASAELRGLPGVWAAVKYVCHMKEGERDLALISTHAKWMLAADPDAGLEMFGSMQPPLPPSAVLPMLTSYAPSLAGAYLEAALASGAADPSVYEQELARIYLERITSCSTDSTTAPDGGAGKGAAGKGEDAAAAAAVAAAAAGPPPEAAAEYAKLKQLILTGCHLDHEALLRVVPQYRLLEIRAALLERLGRHTEALRIYVHRLRQLPLAEAYCDRVYQRRQQQLREQRRAELAAALRKQRQQQEAAAAAAVGGALAAASQQQRSLAGTPVGSTGSIRSLQFSSGGGAASTGSLQGMAGGVAATKLQAPAGSSASEDGADIYLLLVQVLLEEEDSSGAFRPVQHAPDHRVWGEVARLLSRKRDAIQPLHALSLLPGEVPLSSALPFLEGALWGASERRRAAAVARNLRRAEHVALLGQLADERQRSVVLTPERNCSICYKRIGTAAMVAFPSGLLAHYSCWKRASLSGSNTGGASGAQQVAAVAMGGSRVAVVGGGGREWA